jgi:hypothetical protein
LGIFSRDGIAGTPDGIAWDGKEHTIIEVKSNMKVKDVPKIDHLIQLACNMYAANLSRGYLVQCDIQKMVTWELEFPYRAWDYLIPRWSTFAKFVETKTEPPSRQYGKKEVQEQLRELLAPHLKEAKVTVTPDRVKSDLDGWFARNPCPFE